MKLLLTSQGLFNPSISQAMFDLVGKPANETSVAFVPTGMNATDGNKSWFVEILSALHDQGLKFLDIVDFSALPENVWLPRLEAADVIFFCGGSTPHIMNSLKTSGLDKILPELLQTRVYVGNSAGSIIMSPEIIFSSPGKKEQYKEDFGYESEDGLGLIDFHIRPHYGKPESTYSKKEVVEELASKLEKPVYLLDDASAVKVDGDSVEVISEGEYYIFNQ